MITDPIAFLGTAALKATVVFAAALMLSLVLRRASAAARYFLWTSALATALAIPLLSLSVRPWNVPVSATVAAVSILAVAPAAPADVPVPAVAFAMRLAEWLIPLWLCGAAAVLARLAVGHARVRVAIRGAEAVEDAEWRGLLGETMSRLKLRRQVDLRWSEHTEVPFTYGLLRPAILLPRDADQWSGERRRLVLLHELTHVRRLDSAWCILAHVACAVYWFHPLAWLAVARFRREQERSCDDAVLRTGMGQSDYAGHLVELARAVTNPGERWPVALGMADSSDFEQRVDALLDPRRKRRGLSRRAALAALAAVAVCAIPFAAVRAQETKPTSSLTGLVYDPSGAVVPGATVRLKNSNGKNQESTRSNAAGEYKFQAVEAGKYEIEVLARGFKRYQKSDLSLVAGNVMRLDAGLEVGAVTESVDVIGKRGAQPVSTRTPTRIRVGGNVQATKLVRQAKPVYPPNAEAAGVEGTVLLKAVISVKGEPIGLTSISNSAPPELVQAALDAVRQWRYQPTLLNGQPVEVVTTIEVNFRLE